MKFSLVFLVAAVLAYANAAPASNSNSKASESESAKLLGGYYSTNPYNLIKDTYQTESQDQYGSYKPQPTYSTYGSSQSTYSKQNTYPTFDYNSFEIKLNQSVSRVQSLCDLIETQAVEIHAEVDFSTASATEKDPLIKETATKGELTNIRDSCLEIKLLVKKARLTSTDNLETFITAYNLVQTKANELIAAIQRAQLKLVDANLVPTSLRGYVELLLEYMIEQAIELKHEAVKQVELVFKALQSKYSSYSGASYSGASNSGATYGGASYGRDSSASYGSTYGATNGNNYYGASSTYKGNSYPPTKYGTNYGE